MPTGIPPAGILGVPGMALNLLVKVQPRVYIAKCRKAQGFWRKKGSRRQGVSKLRAYEQKPDNKAVKAGEGAYVP